MAMPIAAMLAYYVHNFSPFVVEFSPGIGLRWYGLAYVLAFALGYWLYRWLALRRYTEMPPHQVPDFITWAAVFGVMVGGRLGWVIFYAWRDVISDPLQIVQVWKGGMSSHGGILGLVLFTLWYSRRHKLSWTSIGDNLCVVAPIGLFLVRIANFINGELYGRPTDVPWAVIFPPDPTPRHPSQLYEALLEGAVLFCALFFLRTRTRVPRGVITGAFFILYAVLRIIGEIFREPDPAWAVGTLSAGQFLSVFMLLIGALFIAWGFRTRQFEPIHAR
jgi:phosphatidylglycerol:prolipoprotein diacylglycerol transferase